MANIITQVCIGIISSAVNVYIIFNFMGRFFERAYESKLVYKISFLVCTVIFFVTNIMIASGILSMFITIGLILFIGMYLHRAQKNMDLLLILIFFLFLILTELIGQLIVSIIYSGHFSIEPGNVVQGLITFFSYQLIMQLVRKEDNSYGQAGQWYLIVIVPVISFFEIITIAYLSGNTTDAVLLIMATWGCILIFLLNIFVFLLFNKISRLNYEKEKMAMIEQQSQMQFRYMHELEEKNQNSNIILHDIKNHLTVLEEIYTCDIQKGIEYGNSLRGMIDERKSGIVTRSRVLNILLYHKAEVAENHNIKFKVSCEDIDFSFISDLDMNRLFSNLLDNAFDECVHNNLAENFVELIMCQINNFVVVRILNSSEKEPAQNENGYISQKKGHMGIGLSNIKDVVKKYDGTMKVDYAKNVFTVQITFTGVQGV